MATNKTLYYREYQRRRYHERRTDAIQILGGKCIFCGSTEELEIDHIVADTKIYEFTYITKLSYANFLKHLQDCWLLCHECHAEKTRICKDKGIVDHGGGISGKKNCKCELCKAKMAEYMHDYHIRRKQKIVDTLNFKG